MKKLQIILLALFILGLTASLSGQKMTEKVTDDYSISYSEGWTALPEESPNMFIASYAGGGMVPLTFMVGCDDISEEDANLSLEKLAMQAMDANNQELIAMGLEDMIDIVESGPSKLNGFDCHFINMNVDLMGMSLRTDSYFFVQKNKMISLLIMGLEDDFETHSDQISSITKSFRLK